MGERSFALTLHLNWMDLVLQVQVQPCSEPRRAEPASKRRANAAASPPSLKAVPRSPGRPLLPPIRPIPESTVASGVLGGSSVRRWPDPQARTLAGPFTHSVFEARAAAALDEDTRKRREWEAAREVRMQRLQERLEQRAADEAEAVKKRTADAATSAGAADAPAALRPQARPLRHHKPRAAMGWRGTNMYALGDDVPHLEFSGFPSGFPSGLTNPPFTRSPRPPGVAPPLPYISPSPRAARLVARNEKPHDARVGTTVLDGIVVRVEVRARGAGVGGGRREAERRRELAGEPRTPGGRRRVQWWSTRRAPGDEAEMAAAKAAAAAYMLLQEARTVASMVIQRCVRRRRERRDWPFVCRRFVDVVAYAEQQREREEQSLGFDEKLDAAARCVQRAERRRRTTHDKNLFTTRCREIAADLDAALEPLALLGRRLEVKAAVRLQRWWRSQRRSEKLRRAVQAALKLQRGLRRASQKKRAKRESERRGRGRAMTTRVETKRATTRHSPLGATRLSRSQTPSVKVL